VISQSGLRCGVGRRRYGTHPANEYDVIARLDLLMHSALQACQRARNQWDATHAGGGVKAGETILVATGKAHGQCLLVSSQNVYGKAFICFECVDGA